MDSGSGVALDRRQAMIWNNADPIHCRVSALLNMDMLRFRKCNGGNNRSIPYFRLDLQVAFEHVRLSE